MKNTHTPYASTRLSHLDVLVSGASVAGPAVALALSLHGARVTVVEKAPPCARADSRSTSAAGCTARS